MIHFNFEFCNFFLHQFDDSLDESIGTTLEKMQYNVFREIRIRIHFFHSFANDDRNQKKKKKRLQTSLRFVTSLSLSLRRFQPCSLRLPWLSLFFKAILSQQRGPQRDALTRFVDDVLHRIHRQFPTCTRRGRRGEGERRRKGVVSRGKKK